MNAKIYRKKSTHRPSQLMSQIQKKDKVKNARYIEKSYPPWSNQTSNKRLKEAKSDSTAISKKIKLF